MNSLVQPVTTLLSLGTIVLQFFVLLLIFSLILKKEEIIEKRGLGKIVTWISRYVLEIGFLVSFGAMLSSLFYSNIAHYAPCELCWWARGLIYPQVVVFAVAIYYKNKNKNSLKGKTHQTYQGSDAIATSSSLILSGIGLLVSGFQYYGATFNPGLLEACVAQGVSCSKNYFTSFGYITIPLMSVTCFALLVFLMLVHKRVAKLS